MNRYKQVKVCKECGFLCDDRKRCSPARVEKMRKYSGVRFTSDGFDCALPVSIDSHSHCSYGCLYCFSDNLISHRVATSIPIGQTSLLSIENIFSGREGVFASQVRKALKYDKRNAAGYPCPIQLGAINDPCDHIERQQGWLLKFMELAIKYRQPVRMSTKGNIFLLKDYLDVIEKAPELFWVAFSIITPDDDIIALVDKRAPNASERLEAMKTLSGVGVKTSLRFRPILPGISDRTKNIEKAYKVLIEKAAESGACAISYEVGFVPGTIPKKVRDKWYKLSCIANFDFESIYRNFGHASCIRPPFQWTEHIMHAIAGEAKKNGLIIGVSDPVWKQLGETGCCCGILPDDHVFGNWQEESATNQLILARDHGKLLKPDDVIPEWARMVKLSDLCNLGTGPETKFTKRHRTWADRLRYVWNDLSAQRSALNYFQGALIPVQRLENGDVVYKYKGLERQYGEPIFWRV